jgi:Fe-S cluster assembly protein SufB
MAKKNSKNITISNTWDFQDEVSYTNKIIKGINEDVVRQISSSNKEPEWMLDFRLDSLKIFREKDMPKW